MLLTGDARFFWPETLQDIIHLPHAWDTSLNTGIGQSGVNMLWINTYLSFSAFFTKFGISWNTALLLFWLLPAVIIAYYTAYELFLYFFPVARRYAVLSGFLYIINTYFLLLFFGGQVGIVFAYAFLPLVLRRFIILFYSTTWRNSLTAGLSLAALVLFDPRITYIAAGTIIYAFIFFRMYKRNIGRQFVFSFSIPLFVTGLLHAFWILPMLFFRTPVVPQNVSINNLQSFIFFSFADFTHAFSLLHPNWPDNIFGKVSFMQPEFLLIPMLGFSYLLLSLKKAKEKVGEEPVLFFSMLVLVGALLAKGANEPMKGINEFLFQHLPGMGMFRDPTKFYMLIAVSYSVLIPYSVFRLQQVLNEKKIQKRFPYASKLCITILCILFLFLFRQVISSGMVFRTHTIPSEYATLKDFISHDKGFYRTLWLPQWQRYGFFSDNHPAIGRGEVIGDGPPVVLAKKINSQKIQNELHDLSVRYVIVPYDSEGELFVKDHQYDDHQYREVKHILDQTKGVSFVRSFGKILVYKTQGYADLFSLSTGQASIAWDKKSSEHYQITLKRAKIDRSIVFAMNFDPNWTAVYGSKAMHAQRAEKNLMYFVIPAAVEHVDILYKPQQLVNLGLGISLASLLAITVSLLLGRKKYYD